MLIRNLVLRNRLRVRSLATQVALILGILAPVDSATAQIDDWSMFHHDAQRTGVSSSSMPDPVADRLDLGLE